MSTVYESTDINQLADEIARHGLVLHGHTATGVAEWLLFFTAIEPDATPTQGQIDYAIQVAGRTTSR